MLTEDEVRKPCFQCGYQINELADPTGPDADWIVCGWCGERKFTAKDTIDFIKGGSDEDRARKALGVDEFLSRKREQR